MFCIKQLFNCIFLKAFAYKSSKGWLPLLTRGPKSLRPNWNDLSHHLEINVWKWAEIHQSTPCKSIRSIVRKSLPSNLEIKPPFQIVAAPCMIDFCRQTPKINGVQMNWIVWAFDFVVRITAWKNNASVRPNEGLKRGKSIERVE